MGDDHPSSPTICGWREWVALPELGIPHVKAKLDTGARTSSLHALDVEELSRDGEPWVRFAVQPWQRSTADVIVVESPVHDRRVVRSSTGHEQERVVIRTAIWLLGRSITTEVTLARRDDMGFRMLVGREALRQGFLVDASRSYYGGRPPRSVRLRNRGHGE